MLKKSFPLLMPRQKGQLGGNETCGCENLFPSEMYIQHINGLLVGSNNYPIPIMDERLVGGADCSYNLWLNAEDIGIDEDDPQNIQWAGWKEQAFVTFDYPSNWAAGFNEGDPNNIKQWLVNYNNSFPTNSPMMQVPPNTNPCNPQGFYVAGADSATVSLQPFPEGP
jgi:hypothetical protein